MKKILVIVIALILVMAFAAGCGDKNESTGGNTGSATEEGSEEVARGSTSVLDTIDVGDVTLDDINILEDDPDASFRAGSHQVGDDWEAASAN